MAGNPKLAAILIIKMQRDWLALDRRTRLSYRTELQELIDRHTGIRWKYFDSEALSGQYQDFVIVEFNQLLAYHNLWESLRDHPIFARPYFLVTQVYLGIERKGLDAKYLAEMGPALPEPQVTGYVLDDDLFP